MSGLFAKVGLDILDHPRFQDAEDECFGATTVWLWLTVWTRKHERNGSVPLRLARKHCLIGGDDFDGRLAALVKHGLVTVEGDTVHVTNYAMHNETKEDISERRASTAKRVKKFRAENAGKPADVTQVKRVSNADCNALHGISVTDERERAVTDSVSDSVKSLEESPRGGGIPDDVAITEPVLAACAMAGARAPTKADVVAMLAWYRQEGKASRDWASSLISWVCKAKTFEARASKSGKPNPKVQRHPLGFAFELPEGLVK